MAVQKLLLYSLAMAGLGIAWSLKVLPFFLNGERNVLERPLGTTRLWAQLLNNWAGTLQVLWAHCRATKSRWRQIIYHSLNETLPNVAHRGHNGTMTICRVMSPNMLRLIYSVHSSWSLCQQEKVKVSTPCFFLSEKSPKCYSAIWMDAYVIAGRHILPYCPGMANVRYNQRIKMNYWIILQALCKPETVCISYVVL